MDIGVLGPLRVIADGGEIEVPGLKERALVARLAAEPGRTVPVDALTDALWGEAPPANGRKVLQTYVLRLRNALEPGRTGRATVVVTDAGGYRLAVPEECVDAVRFASLVDAARTSAREGRHTDAVSLTVEALGLWRGPAYAGFEEAEFAAREARRLDELRLTAQETRWASEVALGNHHAAVPALETLVEAHPWREGLWSSLVLALYRAGRQGDALAAYARARGRLDEDLGVEPGAELRELHRRVLAQDRDLDLVGLDQLPPTLAEPENPMVGRTEELAELQRAWERARRGGTVVAAVTGPPGSGRRRLAQAFASTVAEAGVRVHDGPADHDAYEVLHVLDGGWCETCAGSPRAMLLVLAGPGPTAYPVRPDVTVDLGPLDEEEARLLAGAYLPPEEAAHLAATAADRQPGALHTLARARARNEARERIGAASAGLGEAAAQLTSRRDAIAEAAVTWQEHDLQRLDLPPDQCPWRGLASYGREDRAWFAGRDRLTAELLARVASGRLVAVVGASGSGKSSLVNAGLLGGLAEGVLPGSDGWVQVLMRPGTRPMRELSRAALAASGQDPASIGDALSRMLEDGSPDRAGSPRVLVVDQFEETWTLCQDPGERDAFLDSLVELATVGTGRTVVVVAVRADYVAHLADHAALARLVADNTLLVGVPTPAEIQRAIEVPAARAGLVLDAGLAATIVDDAGSEPGLLPLLSAALTQLWQSRSGTRLGYAAYVGMGGLPGAIAHLAEEVWQELPEGDRASARALLLRLAGPGAGSSVVRRRVPIDELVALPGVGTARVVDALVQARLLTVSDGAVEVAHEALFREWPRLAGWLAEDVTGRAVLRRLAVAASEWDAEGREVQQLWRGARLVSGLEVAESYPDEVTATEREFLDASSEAVDAERRSAEETALRTRRQNRRLRRLLVGVAGLLVVALVAGALTVLSRQEAAAARDEAAANALSAEAKQLAAQAVNEEYHDLALLQAVEAVRSERSPETLGALLTRLTRVPKLIHQVRSPDRFLRVGVSTDGRTVYLSENEPVLWALDAISGEVLWKNSQHDLGIRQIDDGDAGLLVSGWGSTEPAVTMLDPTDGAVVWTVSANVVRALIGKDGDPRTIHAQWTGPDRWLSVTSTHVVEGDAAGNVTRTVPVKPGHENLDDGPPAFLPDGRIAVKTETRGVLIDPFSPQREPLDLPGQVLASSPDGTRLLLVTEDGHGQVMSVDQDNVEPAGPQFEIPTPFLASWSPDGSTLAIGSAEAILVRDGKTGAFVETLTGGHSGGAMAPVFAGADGSVLWVAGRDGVATAWDLGGKLSMLRARRAGGGTQHGAVDLGGERAVALQQVRSEHPHRAHLLDPVTGAMRAELARDEECVCQPVAVAIAADGSIAVGAYMYFDSAWPPSDSGKLAIWSAADGALQKQIDLPLWPGGVALNSDGSLAVVSGATGYAVVDLDTGRVHSVTDLPRFEPDIFMPMPVATTRDGLRAAVLRDKTVHVLSLPDGAEVTSRDVSLGTGEISEILSAAVWSADGSVLVTGSLGGQLQFLDGQTLQPVAPPRLTVGGYVLTLALSPDGSMIVNTGTDGEVRLWDTATWSPLGQPVVEDGGWAWAGFIEDGSRLVVMTEGTSWDQEEIDADPEGTAGRLYSLPTDVDAWIEAACSVAKRELTQSEWDVIRPGQEWRPTCGDG